RRPIATVFIRGPTFDDIGDIGILTTLQPHGAHHVVEQLAGRADKWLPLQILVTSRSLADEQPARLLISNAEYGLRAVPAHSALHALADRLLQLRPVHLRRHARAIALTFFDERFVSRWSRMESIIHGEHRR